MTVKYEISEELYNALVKFYNAGHDLYNEEVETEYNKEDYYNASVDELVAILSEELEDEDDN